MRIKRRDWVAAAAMSAGIAVFLRLASPSGGRLHAPGGSWLLAGLITLGAVLVAVAAASGLSHRPGASSTRRAALLGTATGIAWGFVAAIIKELSSHLGGGIGAVFSTWSLYVLLAVGAAAMLLASHALAAGPLAASQPGFTILDPLSAALLGVFLFAEHIRTSPWDLAGEALALALVIAGAWGLSRSCFILGEFGDPSCLPAGFQAQARGQRLSLPGAVQPGSWPAQQRQPELPGTGDAPALPGRTAPPGNHARRRRRAASVGRARGGYGDRPTHDPVEIREAGSAVPAGLPARTPLTRTQREKGLRRISGGSLMTCDVSRR